METSVRGFNLNEVSCAMDSDRTDIAVKPLLWQLKQGVPASCPSYSRLRKQQLGLDHVTALKGIGKRSVGGGGDSWDKEGKSIVGGCL